MTHQISRRQLLERAAAWLAGVTLAAAATTFLVWLALLPRVPGPAGGAGPGPTTGLLETLAAYGQVSEFSLTERGGKRVTRTDLLGKVWIANFIYTQCTETCPLQSARLARLQTEFKGEPDLRLVSITVDPERDTPAVLARYAERYAADPGRWLFLTGDKRAIYHLAKEGFRLGVVDPDDQARAGRLLVALGPALLKPPTGQRDSSFTAHGSRSWTGRRASARTTSRTTSHPSSASARTSKSCCGRRRPRRSTKEVNHDDGP